LCHYIYMRRAPPSPPPPPPPTFRLALVPSTAPWLDVTIGLPVTASGVLVAETSDLILLLLIFAGAWMLTRFRRGSSAAQPPPTVVAESATEGQVAESEEERERRTGFHVLRGDGEWPRVTLASLEPQVREAYEQVCERLPLDPSEELDTLRRLRSCNLDVGVTVAWVARQREWRRRTDPAGKRFVSRNPGVHVMTATGLARWMGFAKDGTAFFFADLGKFAPHLVSADDFGDYVTSGLEGMREVTRAAAPGAPLYGGIIDMTGWAIWHAAYLRHLLRALSIFLEHYPRCTDKLYLLNAPPFFEMSWRIISKVIDDYTRESIVFVMPHQLAGADNPLLARFEPHVLYEPFGGSRDPREMTTPRHVPGMPRQPFLDAAPELLFDHAVHPLPDPIVRLQELATAEAKKRPR